MRKAKSSRRIGRRNGKYLQDLADLFTDRSHRQIVLWAFDFAEESVRLFKSKYPNERRQREALEAAQDWAAGRIKMRPAQRKILDCHAAAKELSDREDIAICHSIGQACSVVHTAGHAMGYPIYDLTAIIYRYGIDNCVPFVEARKRAYIDRLLYWDDHWKDWLIMSDSVSF